MQNHTTDTYSISEFAAHHLGKHGMSRSLDDLHRELVTTDKATIHAHESATGETCVLSAAVTQMDAFVTVSQDYRVTRARAEDGAAWRFVQLHRDGHRSTLYESKHVEHVFEQHARIIGGQAAVYYATRNGLMGDIDPTVMYLSAATSIVTSAQSAMRHAVAIGLLGTSTSDDTKRLCRLFRQPA